MTFRCLPHAFLATALVLGLLLAGSAPAWAQLRADPTSLSATVPQHETATRTLTLTNTGSAALAFCLSFDRPLQRTAGETRVSSDALGGACGAYGGACGAYGEVLALIDENDVPASFWDPWGLTMTPTGQIFAAERFSATIQTYELMPTLEFVRSFPPPVVEELDNSAVTIGVAYRPDTGTLWWLDSEGSQVTVKRALLVEGDLDGVATGRRIEIPVAETAPPPSETGFPSGLGYDPTRRHFFFIDSANEDIWAVDTLGCTVEGYPVQMEAYPGAALG